VGVFLGGVSDDFALQVIQRGKEDGARRKSLPNSKNLSVDGVVLIIPVNEAALVRTRCSFRSRFRYSATLNVL
jgi:hypothetical protein